MTQPAQTVPPSLIKRGGHTVEIKFFGPTNHKGGRWRVRNIRRYRDDTVFTLWVNEDYSSDTEDRAFVAWLQKFGDDFQKNRRYMRAYNFDCVYYVLILDCLAP